MGNDSTLSHIFYADMRLSVNNGFVFLYRLAALWGEASYYLH
ncbi:hypothetical protein KIS1582_0286 [Cytobacillus firmus]|uniref:Uncharacterized protein n=1 Tax=Cytobacillus firmus TaxID=1399 RepID=A0A800NGU2_CYTFI|nr:hypothetical protein KIS1582_0286 [Cytobacillus firmus]